MSDNIAEEVGDNQESGSIKDKLSFFAHIGGAFCTMIGLVEIIRLVVSYWGTYGLLANFPLEISIYTIGLIWTSTALFKLKSFKYP